MNRVVKLLMLCCVLFGTRGWAAVEPAEGSVPVLPFPTFNWPADPRAFQSVAEPVTYDIQIARDDAFKELIDEDRVYLNRYVHDRPFAPGTYFWRVCAKRTGANPEAWSATHSFHIVPCVAEVQVHYDAAASDHFAAVAAALAQARELGRSGGAVKIVFPKGIYRFDKPAGSLLNLDEMHDLVIDGNGSTVLPQRYNSGLMSGHNVSNVVVMGFTVDYPSEKTFLQGRVIAVDQKNGRVMVRLEPGYPGYDVDYVKRGASFMSLLDAHVDGRLKAGGVNAISFKQDKVLNPDGTWTLTLVRRELANCFTTGDRFVHFIRDGGVSLNILFNSYNITFFDITSYGASSLHYAVIGGSVVNVLHCDWKIGAGRWFSGNADGVHCRGLATGPWIEGCHIQAIGDDGIALYARPARIANQWPDGQKNACICNGSFFNLEVGNEVAFYAPTTGHILLESKVQSATQRPDGRWQVAFDHNLPDHLVTTGDLQHVTQIWNRSKSCGDFVVRRNTICNVRRFGTVFRARRGVVEDNAYEASSTSAIIFKNEPQYPNGLYCSDVVIHGNKIRGSSFDGVHKPPVTMCFMRLADSAHSSEPYAPDIGPRRILIADNDFEDCPTPEIGLWSASDVVIRNNKALKAGAPQPLNILEENTQNIIRPAAPSR